MTMMKTYRSKSQFINPDCAVVGKVTESIPTNSRQNLTKDPANNRQVSLKKGDVVAIKNKELRQFLNKDFYVADYIGVITSVNQGIYLVSLFAQDDKEIICHCDFSDLEIKR